MSLLLVLKGSASHTTTFTADAVVKATQTKAFTVDAVVLPQRKLTVAQGGLATLFAATRATKTLTVDAVVAAGVAVQTTKTFTVDGKVVAPNQTKTFTLDGVIVDAIAPPGSTTTRDTYANFEPSVNNTTALFASPNSTANFERTTTLPS